jgi:hypothetical protein
VQVSGEVDPPSQDPVEYVPRGQGVHWRLAGAEEYDPTGQVKQAAATPGLGLYRPGGQAVQLSSPAKAAPGDNP